jgi:hypothetical protein
MRVMSGTVCQHIFAHLPTHRDAFPNHGQPTHSLASATPVDPLARNAPFRLVKHLPVRPRCTPTNFARVDPDISSGKLTITDAWREYMRRPLCAGCVQPALSRVASRGRNSLSRWPTIQYGMHPMKLAEAREEIGY